jgi:esterase
MRTAQAGPVEVLIPGEVPLRALRWDAVSRGANQAPQEAAPTIILLHGLGDGADSWRPTLAAWPAGGPALPILAFDLPGHGESGWLAAERYRVDVLAESIAAALARLGIARPIPIGHSLGAEVALILGARGLIRPRASILIDWSPETEAVADTAVAAHINALIAGASSRDALVAQVYDRLPLGQWDAIQTVIGALAKATSQGWRVPLDPAIKTLLEPPGEDTDDWALLKALPGTVGIVRGRYSGVLSKPLAARMAATTRTPAIIEQIDGAGHAILLEQPANLAQTLQRLLVR